MDGFGLDDVTEFDAPRPRAGRAKPVKRKWREIEAIKDRQRLQKELNDMDIGLDFSLDDVDL
ncbi:DUF3545 family protein [Vibrio hangzhouensis]|uniref:DUF3545 family protein n=1 Tax=Vibrio hangzhouensis TaxID=462991 RepID=UPI001C96451D|nr:DUF3545 family protein [Vibrio hangzhouensis]MBY6197138.1 DUF3545 family protein [Vibrio hangzhouensis]